MPPCLGPPNVHLSLALSGVVPNPRPASFSCSRPPQPATALYAVSCRVWCTSGPCVPTHILGGCSYVWWSHVNVALTPAPQQQKQHVSATLGVLSVSRVCSAYTPWVAFSPAFAGCGFLFRQSCFLDQVLSMYLQSLQRGLSDGWLLGMVSIVLVLLFVCCAVLGWPCVLSY